jgi:protein-S-isoprenylcysteine O-methyltransferase Ste14
MNHPHSFRTRDPAAPLVPPPAVAGLAGLGGYVVDRIIGQKRVLPRWLRPLGVGAIASGLVLGVWGFMHFKRRDVNPSPWNRPTGFVTDGPYAITRNPMYTGSVLALTGVGLMRGTVPSLLSPALFMAILTRGQIAFEEAALEDAYGEDYVEYKRCVRRWL